MHARNRNERSPQRATFLHFDFELCYFLLLLLLAYPKKHDFAINLPWSMNANTVSQCAQKYITVLFYFFFSFGEMKTLHTVIPIHIFIIYLYFGIRKRCLHATSENQLGNKNWKKLKFNAPTYFLFKQKKIWRKFQSKGGNGRVFEQTQWAYTVPVRSKI